MTLVNHPLSSAMHGYSPATGWVAGGLRKKVKTLKLVSRFPHWDIGSFHGHRSHCLVLYMIRALSLLCAKVDRFFRTGLDQHGREYGTAICDLARVRRLGVVAEYALPAVSS